MTLQGSPVTKENAIVVVSAAIPGTTAFGEVRIPTPQAVEVRVWGGTVGGFLQGSFARGSPRLPLGPQANDILVGITGRGWREDTQQFVAAADCLYQAAETWSATIRSTFIAARVTPLGSTTLAEAFRIDGSVTANDMRIQVFDVTAAAMVRVSRGAVDSGGVGFRVLRVPN